MTVAAVLVVAAIRVFAPWSFFLGGSTHVLPVWQGVGRMHAGSGDYVLYIWMAPASSGRLSRLPHFNGGANLCTPRGERIALILDAQLLEPTGADSNGKPMSIRMHRRPWNYSFLGAEYAHPRLELHGRWQNPDLVMDDGGTLAREFGRDGTLYPQTMPNRPPAGEKVPVTFHETSWTGWMSDCR